MKILAHTSFIGTTGYAEHARAFFCALNKYHTVKVRNLTVGNTWKGMSDRPFDEEPYITDEMKDMLILQTLFNNDGTRSDYPMYGYKGDYKADVHIVLNDMDNHQFYDNYDGYKIAFNVYESTRYPDGFFKRLLTFDELWVPTQWQAESIIEQGYPREKVVVIPEGVDVDIFKPIDILPKKDKFRFLLFGRWDYRKSTTEILKAFGETYKNNNKVELIASVENPYSSDGTKSTEERAEKHDIKKYKNIKFVKFPSRDEYIKYLQEGDVFLSCARSEGWNLPLIEAMSCGIPSIYSNWGGQLEFAKNKGIPVKISHIRPARIYDRPVEGEYCEPDFEDLVIQMKNAYENFEEYRKKALEESKIIHNEFIWDKVAKRASIILEKKFVFVSAGNYAYMPIIEKMVTSLKEFSKSKIIVYGINCDVPFESSNVIKKRLNIPETSPYDKWYWKQHACIESIKEDYENFVWIDGDVVANYNIDNITKFFPQIENYPLSDIHVQEEFFGYYKDRDGNGNVQLFNRRISNLWNVQPQPAPYMHICFYIYNKNCKWWFEEIIKSYKEIDPKDYQEYCLWNDEGIDNILRWKHGFTKHLPLSNYDTSGIDGGSNTTMNEFYKYWNEKGPQNFNKVYGYQIIPEDKTNIIYFHGNKNAEYSDKMIKFIKHQKNNTFYQSYCFYTDVYHIEDFEPIVELPGSTLEVAAKYGWPHAIFHEIYNLRDYYLNRKKRIHNGAIVVDAGANIGVFTRWAYHEGAKQVIAFEPDKRYFEVLKLNANPGTILFNAALSDTMGVTTLYESQHLGGSNILSEPECKNKYHVRTYTLDYLFETGLIEKIDFLKIDIEGAEHQLFKGISDINLLKIGSIAMEYHHAHIGFSEILRDNLIFRLTRLGFQHHLLFLGSDNNLQLLYFWK